MKRAALAAFLGLVLVAASAAPPVGAAAGDVTATGWWSRNPGQSAPAGGGAVALAPDGPVTVTAIRIDAAEGLSSATLSLVETGGVGQASGGIAACVAADDWEPAEGGALSDAPATECDDGIVLERDADASTWTADISSLVADAEGSVTVALVPSGGDDPLAPPFDIRFAAPVVEAVPAPDADDGGGGSFDFGSPPPPASDTGSSAQPAPTFAPAPETGSFGVETPASPAADPSPEPLPAETTDDGPAPEPEDELAFTPLVPTADVGGEDHRTVGKAVSYVVISAIAGAAVAGGSRLSRTRFGGQRVAAG